ncbi:MAG: DUF87 domain-containing protein, partial [Elusimicrobiota bacterium]|nr:DUF87 domain-containing protein [Elusimicrobiota bacterium]
MSTNKIGQVLSCAPGAIVVVVDDLKVFEEHKENLQVGRYLRIAQGNSDFTVAAIRNIKGVSPQDKDGNPTWQFYIECQAVGTLVGGKTFERASVLLPVPTEPAFAADKETLDKLFAEDANYKFPLGQLSLNKSIALKVNGDRFFSKHIAIVGSTGSGKSCTVARILQDVVGIAAQKNDNIGKQNNSHIVIFDIHDEYSAAFALPKNQSFTLNRL